VNGIVGTEVSTSKNISLNGKSSFQNKKNEGSTALINPANVYVPPLRIELGTIKNFVTAREQNDADFCT
jgi:hypothetical protein